MGKIIVTLELPEPKIRRKTAKAVQYHKDKSKYDRKLKHKGPWSETQGPLSYWERRRLCPGARSKFPPSFLLRARAWKFPWKNISKKSIFEKF
ncbi:MAG: hypothetical protein LBQ63_00545 [Deltaproteobacteria bacterium]|jgi:hypothetical protein|nr:hypothetical protein [Deltaproteobacteria bacterium]